MALETTPTGSSSDTPTYVGVLPMTSYRGYLPTLYDVIGGSLPPHSLSRLSRLSRLSQV